MTSDGGHETDTTTQTHEITCTNKPSEFYTKLGVDVAVRMYADCFVVVTSASVCDVT